MDGYTMKSILSFLKQILLGIHIEEELVIYFHSYGYGSFTFWGDDRNAYVSSIKQVTLHFKDTPLSFQKDIYEPYGDDIVRLIIGKSQNSLASRVNFVNMGK